MALPAADLNDPSPKVPAPPRERVVRMVPSRADRKARPNMIKSTATPLIVGLLLVAALVGGFGVWAVTAPLAGAAIAAGTVSPDGQSKDIQHLEGGIVREIMVRDGSRVAEGEVLLTLLDTKASSTYQQDLVTKYVGLATRTRLETALDTLEEADPQEELPAVELTFPEELVEAARTSPRVMEIMDSERRTFRAWHRAYNSTLRVSKQAIVKSESSMTQLQKQIDSIVREAALMDESIAVIGGLADKGLESKSKVLDLQRQRVSLDGEVAALEVRIASDRETIVYTKLEIENLRTTQLEKLSGDAATVRSEVQTIDERLRLNRETLDRTVVRSPVAGSVVDLQVHTVGGVVAAGQVLMKVVPENDKLTINAYVSPNDIDTVHAGQDVRVVLTAYPQRDTPSIAGTMTSLSADSITDSEGNTFYLGKVEVSADSVAALGKDVRLVPGMEVELFIMSKTRTFLDYLLDPIIRSMRRSFVET